MDTSQSVLDRLDTEELAHVKDAAILVQDFVLAGRLRDMIEAREVLPPPVVATDDDRSDARASVSAHCRTPSDAYTDDHYDAAAQALAENRAARR